MNLATLAAIAVFGTSCLAWPHDARASTMSLDGAVVYDGANDGYGWTSSTVPGGYRLYISPNSAAGSFINAPDSTISYNLSPGANVFYMFAFGDLPLSYPEESTFGLNLFINDAASLFSSAPQLSGTTAANYGSGGDFSSTSLSPTTPGSLTYSTGDLLVTLSDFNFKIPNDAGTGYNRVSAFSPSPDSVGTDNAIGEFTLNVSDVPETSTWAMMILGFLGIGLLAYRRKNGALRIA
jgi:hypothetical protein